MTISVSLPTWCLLVLRSVGTMCVLTTRVVLIVGLRHVDYVDFRWYTQSILLSLTLAARPVSPFLIACVVLAEFVHGVVCVCRQQQTMDHRNVCCPCVRCAACAGFVAQCRCPAAVKSPPPPFFLRTLVPSRQPPFFFYSPQLFYYPGNFFTWAHLKQVDCIQDTFFGRFRVSHPQPPLQA